jgi:hypothetical protein
MSDQPFVRPLPNINRINTNIQSMPRVGFGPTIPAFERAKTFHALDRAATVIGETRLQETFIATCWLTGWHHTTINYTDIIFHQDGAAPRFCCEVRKYPNDTLMDGTWKRTCRYVELLATQVWHYPNLLCGITWRILFLYSHFQHTFRIWSVGPLKQGVCYRRLANVGLGKLK